MKDLTWLRDYFTDAEIEEYRYNILKKYFVPKDITRGERKAESKLQRVKRRGTGKIKIR